MTNRNSDFATASRDTSASVTATPKTPTRTAVRQGPSGTTISIRVVPRSGRTAIVGERHGAMLVRIAAAPVDGAANDALLAFLADRLNVRKRHVHLESGHRGRDKRVVVDGLSARDATSRLNTNE